MIWFTFIYFIHRQLECKLLASRHFSVFTGHITEPKRIPETVLHSLYLLQHIYSKPPSFLLACSVLWEAGLHTSSIWTLALWFTLSNLTIGKHFQRIRGERVCRLDIHFPCSTPVVAVSVQLRPELPHSSFLKAEESCGFGNCFLSAS